MIKITLTGEREGKTIVLAKRYPFEDGVMVIENDDEGAKIYNFLKKYYDVKASKNISEPEPEVTDHVNAGNMQAGDNPAGSND